MIKYKEWLYLLMIVGLFIALLFVNGAKPNPTKTVVVHDNTPTTGCSLPIAVGDNGLISKGDWGSYQAVVVGKIDNGIDCAYSVKIPQSQNLKRDVYINVNSDNLMPINGETVR